MSRISLMTWGLLLILIGVQLNLVDSFVLTPQATRFWKSKLTSSPFEDGAGASQGPKNQLADGAPGQSFSNQYAARGRSNQQAGSSFPYSTPNYRRFRNDGQAMLQANNNGQNSKNGTFRNAAYGNGAVTGGAPEADSRFAGQKMLSPPSWFCWPPIFAGAVMFLFGAGRRDS